MTRIGLVCAALVCTAALAAPAGAKPVRMTHTISIKGELVNHWTYDEPGACGVFGDGTVTVSFETTVRVRVLPYVDPYIRSEAGRYGVWVVVVPIGANRDRVTGVGHIPGKATITMVDNTARRPQDPKRTDPCPEIDKRGCGTFPLRLRTRPPLVTVGRVDSRRISVSLGTTAFKRDTCGTGALEFFSDHRYSGGLMTGELPVKMPTASALKRRRVTRASGTSHKRTVYGDPGDESTSDDVTRKATVTFTRR